MLQAGDLDFNLYWKHCNDKSMSISPSYPAHKFYHSQPESLNQGFEFLNPVHSCMDHYNHVRKLATLIYFDIQHADLTDSVQIVSVDFMVVLPELELNTRIISNWMISFWEMWFLFAKEHRMNFNDSSVAEFSLYL